MSSAPSNSKLDYCRPELKALLNKLLEGNYQITAEFIYDHIANSGVDIKIHPELAGQQTMKEFLTSA